MQIPPSSLAGDGFFGFLKRKDHHPQVIYSGLLMKKGNIVQSWKRREFHVLQQQVFRYIDPATKVVKGELNLTKCCLEIGNPNNLNLARYDRTSPAVSVNLIDFTESPPRTLEMVLANEEEFKELALAIFLVSEDNNIKTLYKQQNWDTSQLVGFKPRLASRSEINCRTSCCCCSNALTNINGLSILGCADYCACFCCESYGQFGINRGGTLDPQVLQHLAYEDVENVKSCFHALCCDLCANATTSGYKKLDASMKKFKDSEEFAGCLSMLYDHTDNSCCCYMFEVPYIQLRCLRENSPTLKGHMTCCCVDQKCSLPFCGSDDDIPCDISCCGLFIRRFEPSFNREQFTSVRIGDNAYKSVTLKQDKPSIIFEEQYAKPR